MQRSPIDGVQYSPANPALVLGGLAEMSDKAENIIIQLVTAIKTATVFNKNIMKVFLTLNIPLIKINNYRLCVILTQCTTFPIVHKLI